MNTIIELMDQAVAKYRDLPALIIKPGFRTRIWSYADIGELVPRVAGVLRASGVEPGDRVLVWAVNRPEWGISFLGLLWAGAVVVPADVRTTDELAMKLAAQTRAKLVLASLPTLKSANRLELPALAIESLVDMARGAEPLARSEIDPDALAEIVYTSGTTGDPKGVMLDASQYHHQCGHPRQRGAARSGNPPPLDPAAFAHVRSESGVPCAADRGRIGRSIRPASSRPCWPGPSVSGG